MTRHYLDILADVIRENWDKPALTDYLTVEQTAERTITFGELELELQKFTLMLQQYGVKKNDHIILCGESSINWLISYLGINRYGAVAITILPNLSEGDMIRLIRYSDAKVCLMDQNNWNLLNKREDNHQQIKLCWTLEAFELQRQEAFGESYTYSDHTYSEMCFTSGSTDLAKGVLLTAENISASISCVKDVYKATKNKNMIAIFPLAHRLALLGEVLTPLCQGCHVHIVRDTISLDTLLLAYEKIRPFEIVLVPLMVERLLSDRYKELFASVSKYVEYCVVGGAVLKNDIAQELINLKLPLTVGYGVTETTALISQVSPAKFKVGSCGKICPTLEGRIAPNGEILVRGKNVMLGYYKDPEATAAKIDKDGWLHTGDRGHMDEDGYLYVEGRLEQDMIVLPSGENISPAKVEAIINGCDGVEESIVIARNGKLLALVVMKDFSRFSDRSGFREQSEQEFRNHLLAEINPQLPAYSQLFGLEFLSEPLARTEKKTIKRYLYK